MIIKDVTDWRVFAGIYSPSSYIQIVLNLCNCQYSIFVSMFKSFTWSCCNLQLAGSVLCRLIMVQSSRLAAYIWDPHTLTGKSGMDLVQLFEGFCGLGNFLVMSLPSGFSVCYSLPKSNFSI